MSVSRPSPFRNAYTASAAGAAFCLLFVSGCSSSKDLYHGTIDSVKGTALGVAARTSDAAKGIAGRAVASWDAVKVVSYRVVRTQSAAEADRTTGYKPGSGPVVKIRDARVVPAQVKPGDRLTFEIEYAIASPTSPTTVRETWELWKDDQLLSAVPPQSEAREAGGWLAKASVTAPSEAKPGKYIVKNRVEAGDSHDERVTTFTIS